MLDITWKNNSDFLAYVHTFCLTVEDVTEVMAREALYVKFARNHKGQIMRLHRLMIQQLQNTLYVV